MYLVQVKYILGWKRRIDFSHLSPNAHIDRHSKISVQPSIQHTTHAHKWVRDNLKITTTSICITSTWEIQEQEGKKLSPMSADELACEMKDDHGMNFLLVSIE